MVSIVQADYILPVSSTPMPDGAVAFNEQGDIIALYRGDDPELIDKPVERLRGIIVPGFVNAHCHLELSHLVNTIPKHEGLVSFIKQVIRSRGVDDVVVLEAMEKADATMGQNGIVAVGDISNTGISKSVKQTSKLYYHTFVEVLGFDPTKAEEIFQKGVELKDEFAPLPASVVPHAPYSVSKELFHRINRYASQHRDTLLTMHNQESEAENQFYQDKTGGFLDFYQGMNIAIDAFQAQGRNSVQSVLPWLPDTENMLLVHNTYTTRDDLNAIHRSGRKITWCFCPKANLYIENRLPEMELFLASNLNITLGTDSLASNDSLCILSELKTLHQAFSDLELTETIKWATLNGAEFLQIADRFGSIEKGKKPGLNLITEVNGLKLTANSQVKKLV